MVGRFLGWAFVALMITGTAHAQSAASREALLGQANPYAQKLEATAKDLFEQLSEAEKESLTRVRTNFGVLRSIEIVHGDVKKAVTACGKANPDMKDDGPQEAFGAWENAVLPRVKAQKKAMEQAMTTKHFSDPAKIKNFLQQIDDAARHAEKMLEKNVLDDEAHCRALGKSLRDGQDSVTAALDGLVWFDGAPEEGTE